MTRIREKITVWIAALGVEHASDELAREQYRLLAKQVPILYSIITLNGLFMSIAVVDVVPFELMVIFPAILIPAMIARLWLWRSRRKTPEIAIPIEHIRKSLRGNIISAGILSILFAIMTANLLWALPPDRHQFVPIFLILNVITCAYCLACLPAAACSVIISGALLICATTVTTGGAMLTGMGANIAIVLLFVMYMVSQQYQQLRRIVKSRSEIFAQQAHAYELAHHDQLTSLPNRRALIEKLYKLQSERWDQPIAMAMIDLNGFKPVNDTYGHAAGDKLLITIGQRLKNILGKDGYIARLGGDEFAILFEKPKDIDWMFKRAEQVMFAINRPQMIEENELRVTAGIGIASKAKMPEDPLELLKHADIALYEAKAKNRNAVCMYEGGMEARVRRRTMIEQALSDRAQMSEITLHYQPIVNLQTMRLEAFESLARWDHPELGRISPAEFVEAAERNGLATRLTIHLFRQAVEAAKTWDDETYLSFNLSGSGLGTSNLDKLIPEILQELEFNPGRLALEISESALLGDPLAVKDVLEKLQKIGVKIVLDDFGTGCASLTHLRGMNFSGIKLDGSLIKDIEVDVRSRELFAGLLHLCRALGSEVTAKNVENEGQLAVLKALPVKNAQGYLLGRPLSVKDIAEPKDCDKISKQWSLGQNMIQRVSKSSM